MYDATQINAHWDNQWPTDLSDASNRDHEHSPVLMAPVANLLGRPWYMESESIGGDFVIWLEVEHGAHADGRVGVSPHPAPDGLMRWMIGLIDNRGRAVADEHELLITESADTVAARVRQFLTEHGIATPTPVAMAVHDATQINPDWGDQWPTDLSDASNHGHERSPLLMAPVAALLGRPWYLEAGSPGADFAIWLNIERGAHVGGRVGLCPFPALDGLMRWTIELTDPAGNPLVTQRELLITEPPDTVAARARQFLTDHGIETPTQVAMAAGFDYDGFQFSDAFPVPVAYVVVYGMVHFRGPDGYLWFVPDYSPGEFEWGCPQNIAEFDQRNCDPDEPYDGPEYQAVMAEICRLVDAVTDANTAYMPALLASRRVPTPDEQERAAQHPSCRSQ